MSLKFQMGSHVVINKYFNTLLLKRRAREDFMKIFKIPLNPPLVKGEIRRMTPFRYLVDCVLVCRESYNLLISVSFDPSFAFEVE